jgi:hypothetical protein
MFCKYLNWSKISRTCKFAYSSINYGPTGHSGNLAETTEEGLKKSLDSVKIYSFKALLYSNMTLKHIVKDKAIPVTGREGP